ncbi:MAG: alpha-L-glutamate ligase-like protein [Thiotrichales bacterium]|nr:alpha-L-glutamate ligase-like protein [Thiotrichales bacterium]
MKWFATPSQLRARGVVGLNQRNSDYIMRYNPRHLYPLVDDKVYTKRLALEQGIAVPELYGVLSTQHETAELDRIVETHQEFVMKPSHGSGGNGILVIDGRLGSHYRKANGDLVSSAAIVHHASNIVSGMYSLGGASDQALIEYRVQFDPFFSHISYQGVPDIRVIVFRGVPIAAMARLPTRASDGKANLHQGAMGIGIDLETGISKGGVCNDEAVDRHPDTGYETTGIKIPHWDEIMKLAIRCADTVGLGYLGVDIVMDRDRGPLMLELNARPGLNVQIANQMGLYDNLKKIESIDQLPDGVEERLAMAKAA